MRDEIKLGLEDRILKPQKKKSSLLHNAFIILIALALVGGSFKLLVNIPGIVFEGPLSPFNDLVPQPAINHAEIYNSEPQENLTKKPAATRQLLEDDRKYRQRQQNKETVYIEQAPAVDEPEVKQRQTVFNDSNYQPKGAVNTIAPPPAKYYDPGKARDKAYIDEAISRSVGRNTSTSRTIPWSWKSQKTHHSGTFSFIERNGRIHTGKVCSNFKYGSFIYRDCRKAARKYFNEACSGGYKAACTAANMTP